MPYFHSPTIPQVFLRANPDFPLQFPFACLCLSPLFHGGAQRERGRPRCRPPRHHDYEDEGVLRNDVAGFWGDLLLRRCPYLLNEWLEDLDDNNGLDVGH